MPIARSEVFVPMSSELLNPIGRLGGSVGGSGSAMSSRSAWNLAGLIHNLSGTAQDVAYAYARNQAQEIITQTWSNDAYQWRGGVNGVRGYSANGLNQYTSVAGAALGFDASGNLKRYLFTPSPRRSV